MVVTTLDTWEAVKSVFSYKHLRAYLRMKIHLGRMCDLRHEQFSGMGCVAENVLISFLLLQGAQNCVGYKSQFFGTSKP